MVAVPATRKDEAKACACAGEMPPHMDREREEDMLAVAEGREG